MARNVVIVTGGELARDVAEQTVAKKPDSIDIDTTIRSASDKPKTLVDYDKDTVLCFIIQTIENNSPTEEGGSCIRFFKRKTHPQDLLKDSFSYAVLGLGDSNLLMDRQTTTAKDCNFCAQQLDSRLEALGGSRFHYIGMADEREGLNEDVSSWIESFWSKVEESL